MPASFALCACAPAFVYVCMFLSLSVCVCEFVCGAVFGGLEPVASYCLTCALDLLSILFVIIVVVTVVVAALSLPHCVYVCLLLFTLTQFEIVLKINGTLVALAAAVALQLQLP